jgi:hypothetical protein
MKKHALFLAVLLAALCAAKPALAQEAKKNPPGPAPNMTDSILEQWNDVGRKLVAMAEDFPDDKYTSYKPAPESRSFKANLVHAAASMYYFTDIANGKKPRYPDEYAGDDLKTKADVVAFVKKCISDGVDAIKAKGDSGLNQAADAGGKHLYRLYDLAYGLIEHSGEHYGQVVVYYRANGLVPPESRPKK